MAVNSIQSVLPRIANEHLEFRKYVNFLVLLMERRQGAEYVYSRPFEATIDPSSMCHLSCPVCELGNGTIRRKKALLDPVVHERFVSQFAQELFVAWYFSTGEPLLNPRLHELLALLKGREVFSIISTNLSLQLSDTRIDHLLHCGLGIICVSLDGATHETYGRYRIRGDFDLVVKNMLRLVRRKRELGLEFPLIEWRYLVFRHNQHEVAHARQLALSYGVDLLEFFPASAPPDSQSPPVQTPINLILDPPVSGPAMNRSSLRRDTTMRQWLGNEPSRELSPPEGLQGRKCDWLYFGSMLYPTGAVGPCCVTNSEADDFGAATEASVFHDVWNNQRFREARRMFREPTAGSSELVCARCPNPDAKDYQFRMTVRGVLRNAPDWVLRILSNDPSQFFLEIDYCLSPTETAPIRDGTLPVAHSFPGVASRLESAARLQSSAMEARMLALRSILEGPRVIRH